MGEQKQDSWLLIAFLTLSGGFMDAYSYMERGQVFANAQTGNLLLLGVNLSLGQWDMILKYICPIVAFIAGIAMAEVFKHYFHRSAIFTWKQIILLIEMTIMIGVMFIPQTMNLLANSLISFACGAQVESFRKYKGQAIATTMCIGNLRSGTEALCAFILKKDKDQLKNGLMFFLIIFVFVIGAVLGNFAVSYFDEYAIGFSGALLLIAFLLLTFKRIEAKN